MKTKIKYVKSKVNNPRLFFHGQWFLRRGPAVGTLFFHLSRITHVMWVAVTLRVVRLVCAMNSDFLPYSSDFLPYSSDFNCRAFYIFFLSSLLLTLLSLCHTLRELPSIPYHHSFFFKKETDTKSTFRWMHKRKKNWSFLSLLVLSTSLFVSSQCLPSL
jgi:hypothetical protein